MYLKHQKNYAYGWQRGDRGFRIKCFGQQKGTILNLEVGNRLEE